MGLFKMQHCRNAYKRAVPSNLFNQFIVSINGFQNVKVIPHSMYSRDNDSTAARGPLECVNFIPVVLLQILSYFFCNSVLIQVNVRGWHSWVVYMNWKVRRLNQPLKKARQVFMLAYNKSGARRIEISLSACCSGHTQERANLGLYIPGWQVPWPLWKQPLWKRNFSVTFVGILVKHIIYLVGIWRQIWWQALVQVMGWCRRYMIHCWLNINEILWCLSKEVFTWILKIPIPQLCLKN